jgi:Predicted metal-dependent hydrolase of the TIM-barrel fold
MNLLQDLGVPLFIPIGQTSWDEIGNIAKQYPKLAILVEAVGHHEYLNMRAALPWLIAAPNLLVPTHNQFLCGGIELLVERIGAERIFFLTNQPFDDPAAALSHLMLSQISDSDKAKISFENSHRLLSQVARGGYFA